MGHTRLAIVAAFLFHSIVARLAGSYICMFVMSKATFSLLDVLLTTSLLTEVGPLGLGMKLTFNVVSV